MHCEKSLLRGGGGGGVGLLLRLWWYIPRVCIIPFRFFLFSFFFILWISDPFFSFFALGPFLGGGGLHDESTLNGMAWRVMGFLEVVNGSSGWKDYNGTNTKDLMHNTPRLCLFFFFFPPFHSADVPQSAMAAKP